MSEHQPIPWLKKPTVAERVTYWRTEIIRLWDLQNQMDGMALYADSNQPETDQSLNYHLDQIFECHDRPWLAIAINNLTDWQICELVLSYWSHMARCTRLIYAGVRNVDLPKWQRPTF